MDMNDPPSADAVRARMQQIRCEIGEDLEQMVASARNVVDWKHHVKTHPWAFLGAAAALGFAIVPKRVATMHTDLAALAELARTGRLGAKPAPSAGRGLVDMLVATVASLAVRKATGWLGQTIARLRDAGEAPPRPPPTGGGISDRASRRG
jgi:hypothetical protein